MDSTTQPLDDPRAFRNSLYRCFERRTDALFELADALLTAGTVPSPVHLSLVPAHEHRCATEDYGEVRVRAWPGLHPKTRRIAERYGCEKAPIVRGTVLLVEVGTPARAPKPCGRSPGRPRGRLSGRAKRYPALKKAA